jgi:mRNA interferase MazF
MKEADEDNGRKPQAQGKFMKSIDPDVPESTSVNGESQIINQGDIFWIQAENSGETGLGFYPHPYVVIQDDLLNHSRIHSVVVCALTTNLKQANAPGNVLLEMGEANLPKHSAVVVSKVTAVNKSQLGAYIGTLTEQRIKQILAGMRLLQTSFFTR